MNPNKAEPANDPTQSATIATHIKARLALLAERKRIPWPWVFDPFGYIRAGGTPGPWEYKRHHQLNGFLVHATSGEAPGVALATRGLDARLISAAPEMLEALKAVVRVADRKTVEFDAARAAIAKAEGRQ